MPSTLRTLGPALSAFALVLAGCQSSPVAAVPTSSAALDTAKSDEVKDSTFEQDRQAILAMAGDYQVHFDFTETVPLHEGYKLKDKKLSGGYEVVRVIEDTGDFISLQHILVVGPQDAPIVVKHWRQDWEFEPERVMEFIGGNAWAMRDVDPEAAIGAWSQTVYQVDDSPRYAAVGHWSYEDDVAQWEPPRTWRPLPRRDMTTRSDYHAVDAINRHTITPFGWVHEQDNTKIVLSGEEPYALVREIGVNSYYHSKDFDPTPAIEYWDATKDYWDFVRDEWDRIEDERDQFAVLLQGETEDFYTPLLTLAEQIQAGETDLESAKATTRDLFEAFVTTDLAPLYMRLRPTETVVASND